MKLAKRLYRRLSCSTQAKHTQSLLAYTDRDEAAVLRAIELSAEKYCPAQAMLSKAFPIRMVYKILGDGGETIKEGEYFSKRDSV